MQTSPLSQHYPWLFLDQPLTIDILFDINDPEEELSEAERLAGEDTADAARQLHQALQTVGHTVRLVPVTAKTYQAAIEAFDGDLVFNQVEEDVLGYKVLALLEERGIPVTGVDSQGFEFSWDKTDIKDRLVAAQVPTPRSVVVPENQLVGEHDLSFPLLVKAANDHGSLSITADSVVHTQEALNKQIQWVHQTSEGDALVEEYIEGREIWATFLGNGDQRVILPIKEITFGEAYQNLPKIVTYDSKWNKDAEQFLDASTAKCPADLTEQEKLSVETAIHQACEALDARDYARFDVRLRDGIPYIIDYNANPALDGDYTIGDIATAFGMTYPEFIGAIVAVAWKRYQ